MSVNPYLILDGCSGGWWLSLLVKLIRKFDKDAQVIVLPGACTEIPANAKFVVLDTTSTPELIQTIERIRRRLPQVSIAVFSAAPTCQEERNCYYAGATVYETKRWDEHAIGKALYQALISSDAVAPSAVAL